MFDYRVDIVGHIRSHPKIFVLKLLLGLLFVWIVFGDYGLVRRVVMENELRSLKAALEKEEKSVAMYRSLAANATQPDSIEKVAREKYNFRRKGETVFIVR